MIQAIITDFDGTLVDTFEANLNAYQKAFAQVGLGLSVGQYRACYGLRYDAFMDAVGIVDKDVADTIKELKRGFYPQFFDSLVLNRALIGLIDTFHQLGGKTSIASTAGKENLMSVVNYLGIADIFDHIFAGVDVKQGKPSPEIYQKAMRLLCVNPGETLIFEDSEVGIQAAKASGAHYMIVDKRQF